MKLRIKWSLVPGAVVLMIFESLCTVFLLSLAFASAAKGNSFSAWMFAACSAVSIALFCMIGLDCVEWRRG